MMNRDRSNTSHMEELFNDGIHCCLAYLTTSEWNSAVRTSQRIFSIATRTEPVRRIVILRNSRRFLRNSTAAPTKTIRFRDTPSFSLIRHITEIVFDEGQVFSCFLTWSEVFTLQQYLPSLTRFECGIIGSLDENDEEEQSNTIFFRPTLTRLLLEFLTFDESREVMAHRPELKAGLPPAEYKARFVGQLPQVCLAAISSLPILTSLTFRDARTCELDWSSLSALNQMREFELTYSDEDGKAAQEVGSRGLTRSIVTLVKSWSATLESLVLSPQMPIGDSIPIHAPHVRKTNVYARSTSANDLHQLYASFPALTQFEASQSPRGFSLHLPSVRLFTSLQSLTLSERPHMNVPSNVSHDSAVDDLTIMHELSLISSLTEFVLVRWLPSSPECWNVLLSPSSPLVSSLRSLQFKSMLAQMDPLARLAQSSADVSRITSLTVTDARFESSTISLFSRCTSLAHLHMADLFFADGFDYLALYTLLSSSSPLYMPLAEQILIARTTHLSQSFKPYFVYDKAKQQNRCDFPGQTEQQRVLHRFNSPTTVATIGASSPNST